MSAERNIRRQHPNPDLNEDGSFKTISNKWGNFPVPDMRILVVNSGALKPDPHLASISPDQRGIVVQRIETFCDERGIPPEERQEFIETGEDQFFAEGYSTRFFNNNVPPPPPELDNY